MIDSGGLIHLILASCSSLGVSEKRNIACLSSSFTNNALSIRQRSKKVIRFHETQPSFRDLADYIIHMFSDAVCLPYVRVSHVNLEGFACHLGVAGERGGALAAGEALALGVV